MRRDVPGEELVGRGLRLPYLDDAPVVVRAVGGVQDEAAGLPGQIRKDVQHAVVTGLGLPLYFGDDDGLPDRRPSWQSLDG